MSDLLNIGRTGLAASKKALETTGHNIANANTDGYSRQKVQQTTNVPITKSGLIHGTGVRVTGVNRVHDQFVEKRLRDSTSENEYFQSRADNLRQVEEIFNEIDNGGLNQVLNRFFNSFRDLANQPENETIRSVVRDNAKLVIKDFNRIRTTLDQLSRNIDNSMERTVGDINQKIKEIATLNRKIAELEAMHGETGDLRDQRDLAIKALSKIVKIHTYEDEKGNFNVAAKGVGTLVTAANVVPLRFGTQGIDQSSNGMDGSGEIFYEGRPSTPITSSFMKGSLSATTEVRNKDIKNLRENIDQIAYDFINSVNAIHKRGYVNREIQTDESGNPVSSFDAQGPVTGINFFKIPTSIKDAALNIDMSDDVKSDLSNIATALSPNSSGDNRVALAISKIQHERFMEGGQSTIEENFLKTVGKVGLESGKAQLDAEQSEGILAQVTNVKERISGVSIDEEAANMVKFQHVYEAAAKVMQTADEMFKTVINIKR